MNLANDPKVGFWQDFGSLKKQVKYWLISKGMLTLCS